nr:DUF4129 domain-containing protein [Desulfobacula sp.]
MADPRPRGVFWTFSGMELFWLFAWAEFLMGSTARLSAPPVALTAAYFLAFALASGFRAKGLRRIWGILGHALAFSALAALALHSATGRLLPPGPGILDWYGSILTLVFTGLFWYKGTKLCFREMSYKMVCNYFDLGLALFFALLLVRLLVFYQSGISLPAGPLPYLMTGFFFTGLGAIFFSNAPTTRKRHYMEGFRGIGVMISFCLAFLLFGLGLVFVLLPLMTSLAESGYTALKGVSGSLGPYLVHILRFILLVPKPRGATEGPPPGDGDSGDFHGMEMTGEAGWFSGLIFYGILAVVAAVALVLIGTLILRLLRFLLQRSPAGPVPERGHSLWSLLRRFLDAAPGFFRKLAALFSGRINTAQSGFSRLMAWGRRSGVKRRNTETPGEYARRLQTLFSPLETEIFTILNAFHLETYGETALSGPELDRMAGAVKKLHAPSFWKMRIKVFWKIK